MYLLPIKVQLSLCKEQKFTYKACVSSTPLLHKRKQLNTTDLRHPEMGAFFHIQI